MISFIGKSRLFYTFINLFFEGISEGITAGVVLLAWTLGGIIGNVLFKENDGGATSPPDEDVPRPSPSASSDPEQTPGGKHYPPVILISPEKTGEEELEPLSDPLSDPEENTSGEEPFPDLRDVSDEEPDPSSDTPKNQSL